jgi:hypothetical protein
MAAAPDDDARRTLAELEAKLRELERELLRGQDTEPAPTPEPPTPEHPAPPTSEPTAPPAAEHPAPPAAEHPARPAAEHPAPPAAEHPAPPAAEHGAPPFAEPPRDEPDPLSAEPHAALQPEPRVAFQPEPPTAEPPPLEPEPEPLPRLDLDALENARDLLDDLRATIDDLGAAAVGVTAEARVVVDDHGRTLARLEKAAQAAARAEQAAVEVGRIAGTVVVEAGPFADSRALIAFRDALAAQPDARDAYVRGVEDGRAVIEVHLAPPPTA